MGIKTNFSNNHRCNISALGASLRNEWLIFHTMLSAWPSYTQISTYKKGKCILSLYTALKWPKILWYVTTSYYIQRYKKGLIKLKKYSYWTRQV